MTAKIAEGSLRDLIMGGSSSSDIKEKLNLEVKVRIEKAQASSGFRESIPEMVLCGTDDKVPGIKNDGKIAAIEGGAQS